MRLLNVRGARDPCYHHKQSCVSFCFNLINAADPNPQVHMPVSQMMPSLSSLTEEMTSQIGKSGLVTQSPPREPNYGIFTVSWFENYVVEYLVFKIPNQTTIARLFRGKYQINNVSSLHHPQLREMFFPDELSEAHHRQREE
jgi:hypothetical protein